MTTTVKHPDRLGEQVNNILANPDSWRQAAYHTDCGTQHCIAGHGQIASGKPMSINTCKADAREWYGLTGEDAGWLFRGYRTLPELYEFAMAALASVAYFDADGYNRSGLDRDGYSICGFNRYGYHRDGYNRNGFNPDGLDRNGVDRLGYDRHGFDLYGYNREGYNRNGLDLGGCDRGGYDRDGYNRKGFARHGFNRHGIDRNGDSLPLLNIAAGDTQ